METRTSTLCRCCASEGPSKDLINKYIWMGEEEVYSDMLKECFDISLTMESQNEQGICELCITQLRNAFNFKKQVLFTDKEFRKNLSEEKPFQVEIKQEAPHSESGSEAGAGDVPFNDDDDDDGSGSDYEPLIKKEVEEKPKKRQTKVAAVGRPKRAKTEPATSKSAVASAALKRSKKKKNKSKETATPERLEHRINLSNILQFSNASPFRDKTGNGFSCLYCAKYFKTIDELREHTALQSEKDKLNKMIDYKLSYNPIKVDITDLKCNICEMSMKDLNELKDHLGSQHNKTIHKDIKDIILPFRLLDGSSFVCVICTVKHISFKNLYQHMSSHYSNYCCDQCGAGYITIAALRKHHKTHENGNFQCRYCEKVYPSEAKKKNHEKGVHISGWLRNKCPHCPEIFVSYYDRSEHLVKVHNEKPVTYPCNACDKVYKKKFDLNRHIRHHHLQHKSHNCSSCSSKFFSRRGLVDHMARHYDGETFPCDVCGKAFTRNRSLKEHMKGHEEGGTKYQCNVCEKHFTQKHSLKSHMRLHQDDLEIFKEFDDVKHLIDNRDLTLTQIAMEHKKKMAAEKNAAVEKMFQMN